MKLLAFRTVLVAAFGCGVLLTGFRWALGTTEGKELFAILRDGVVLMVLGVAVKSLGQHLGTGGGVKGMMAALFTEAKPETPK